MAHRRTVTVEWQDAGVSRSYFVRPGSRSRPWIWFRHGDVPAFDEASARFVIEKRASRWIAVARVDDPPQGPGPDGDRR
jgi:hypothetical protein